MAQIDSSLSTGLEGLDQVIRGLIPGDNIVWQVDSVEDYSQFAAPYCRNALKSGQRLIYFRFAKHPPLIDDCPEAEIHHLYPEQGFEQFITEIHRVIKSVGRGQYYLFDCLSDLSVDWYSDQMLGNFFMLTCPRLYDIEAIAYFSLLRNYHSSFAISPIADTTQVLLDVIRHKGNLYLQPLKVQQRYSPVMYMLHLWDNEKFIPVTQSSMISQIRSSAPWRGLESSSENLNVWNRTFLEAEQVHGAVLRGEADSRREDEYLRRLVMMAISRDERMYELVLKYFNLSDVLDISRRMIGTGLIGGKAVGMLLARAIMGKTHPQWQDTLEPHDSFFIGSDVFYTFLVTNGTWWVRQQKSTLDAFLEGAITARQRILVGKFPENILKQFSDMLDYFGQSPIIVRSSSLLEDSFGNAFAGKYESVFCVNQGPRHKRLEDFLSAVRTIYASTMSEKAIRYRANRGMLYHDEQMGLLVQRVSGSAHENLFYPQVAGVGLSFNPYVWSNEIDPESGMIRLVFGMGTRAVDRSDDDYTRVVALNAPQRRPEANFDEVRQYTQKKVDVLDLESNQLLSKNFQKVIEQSDDLPIGLFASQDLQLARQYRQAGRQGETPLVLTFNKLLDDTRIVDDMKKILTTLESSYDHPLEIEFTANFISPEDYRINILQCRPFQCKGKTGPTRDPGDIPVDSLILESHGAVIGPSREMKIDRFIYVVPETYGQLVIGDRYNIARLIGDICHAKENNPPENIMLLGPGRWGTTTPSLGVPISFADINTISVLCEIVEMREGLVPDVSLGTHLFSELVEMDILYMALFPHKEGNVLNREFFMSAPHKLGRLVPQHEKWEYVVRVIDLADCEGIKSVTLNANTIAQTALCFKD